MINLSYISEFNKTLMEINYRLSRSTEFLPNRGFYNPLTEKNYEYLKQEIEKCSSDSEYKMIIEKLINSLHTEDIKLTSNNPVYFPCIIRYFKGSYYVAKTTNKKLENLKLLHINGILSDRYISHQNTSTYDICRNKPYKLEFALIKDERKELILHLENKRKLAATFYIRDTFENLQEPLNLTPKQSEYHEDNNYLKIPSFTQENYEQTVSQISKIKKDNLILDLRGSYGKDKRYLDLLKQIDDISKYILIDGEVQGLPNEYLLRNLSLKIGTPTKGSNTSPIIDLTTKTLENLGLTLTIHENHESKIVMPDIYFEEPSLITSYDYGTNQDKLVSEISKITQNHPTKEKIYQKLLKKGMW